MTSLMPIGNDILDIGTRKSRRQRGGDLLSAPSAAFGAPGQFDVPNVPDVSSVVVALNNVLLPLNTLLTTASRLLSTARLVLPQQLCQRVRHWRRRPVRQV